MPGSIRKIKCLMRTSFLQTNFIYQSYLLVIWPPHTLDIVCLPPIPRLSKRYAATIIPPAQSALQIIRMAWISYYKKEKISKLFTACTIVHVYHSFAFENPLLSRINSGSWWTEKLGWQFTTLVCISCLHSYRNLQKGSDWVGFRWDGHQGPEMSGMDPTSHNPKPWPTTL